MKGHRKAILIGLGVMAALVIVVAIPVGLDSYKLAKERSQLSEKYQQISLPSYLILKQKLPEGDGVDSRPYWYYIYHSSQDAPTTLKDMQASLRQTGYTLSETEDSHTPGIDPKTLLEFSASNDTAALKLVVAIQKDNEVLVTIESLQ